MPKVPDTAPGTSRFSAQDGKPNGSAHCTPLGLTFVDLLPCLPYLIDSPQQPLRRWWGASFCHCHPNLWKRKLRLCETGLMVEVAEL